MRKSLLAITLIICICTSMNVACSSGIKISPLKYTAKMQDGEVNCTTVWVYPDSKLDIRTRWSKDGGEDIASYNLNDMDVKIRTIINKTSNGKYEICFKADMPGHFYGGVLFIPEREMAGMGMWVELSVDGIGPIETIFLFTGSVINKKNTGNLGLGLVFVLLLIVLGLLIFRYKKSSAPEQ